MFNISITGDFYSVLFPGSCHCIVSYSRNLSFAKRREKGDYHSSFKSTSMEYWDCNIEIKKSVQMRPTGGHHFILLYLIDLW